MNFKEEVKCEHCDHIFLRSGQIDFVCEFCGNFSINIYIFLNSINNKLSESRDYEKRIELERKKEVQLKYFGVIYDSKYQFYSSLDKKKIRFDYISKRFMNEHSYGSIEKIMSVNEFDYLFYEDKVFYENYETISYEIKNLKFIFTGTFTNMKFWLFEILEKYFKYLECLGILNYKKLSENYFSENKYSEIIISYVKVFEFNILLSFILRTKYSNKIDEFLSRLVFS